MENKEKPLNPSAFPELDWCQTEVYHDPVYKTHGGMSLRDYFAAKALMGILTDPNTGGQYEKFAELSYLYAEAMLKERMKYEDR